jgi:hypothetical protein
MTMALPTRRLRMTTVKILSTRRSVEILDDDDDKGTNAKEILDDAMNGNE